MNRTAARALLALPLLLALTAPTAFAEPLAQTRTAKAAPPAPAKDLDRPIDWLAVGDSYSSGEGTFAAPDYGASLKSCHQGRRNAYPQLAQNILGRQGANWKKSDLDFHACTGATAEGWKPRDLSHQLKKNGSKKFDLITLTIGGNDAGFAGMLLDCMGVNWRSTYRDPRCDKSAKEMREQVDETRPVLDDAYDDVEKYLKPGGEVIVLGYPWLFEDPKNWPRTEERCEGIHPDDVRMTRTNVASRLNRVIREVSEEHGFHFLDTERQGAFQGHNLCAAAGEEVYVNGQLVPRGARVLGMFHPNVKGNLVMATALARTLNKINNPARVKSPHSLTGRWEYRGDFATDRASLIVKKDGSARYFAEGNPYEYRGRVQKHERNSYRLEMTGEDPTTGETGEKLTIEPRMVRDGFAFVTRSRKATRVFWLGCMERDVGGSYADLDPSRGGCERNHVPARSAYVKPGDKSPITFGPAVRMEKQDHKVLESTDGSERALKWQAKQRAYLKQCKFAEAMRMDIADIRQRFPGKYDRGIKDMVRSTKTNKVLQKWLKKRGCAGIDYSKLP